jgi:hypothetical protein
VQVLDQEFTRTVEELQEDYEEDAEDKATFLDVLNALEVACKYMCPFDIGDCYVQQS